MQRYLIHVLVNIVIRYMAVVATGMRAEAALVIVGLENDRTMDDKISDQREFLSNKFLREVPA